MFRRCHLRDDYRLGAELGRGAFGVVRRATRRSDGAEAAVKSLERKRVDLSALRREVDVLRAVAGSFRVLALLDVYDAESRLFHIALECVGGGELLAHAAARGASFTTHEVLILARQMAAALVHIHARGVVHRDIKPANVLRRSAPAAAASDWVLVDFGAACRCDRKLRGAHGTVGSGGYMAPEMLRSDVDGGVSEYGTQVDLFSVGVLLHLLLLGTKPAVSRESRVHLRSRRDAPHISRPMLRLLESLLVADPARRLDPRGLAAACDSLLATPRRSAQQHREKTLRSAPSSSVATARSRVARVEAVERGVRKKVGGAMRGAGPRKWGALLALFRAVDTDNDGTISPAELSASLVSCVFSRNLHAAGFGGGGDDEYEDTEALEQAMYAGLFEWADVDGDERLSYTELFVGSLAQCLATSDARLELLGTGADASVEDVRRALVRIVNVDDEIAARVAASVASALVAIAPPRRAGRGRRLFQAAAHSVAPLAPAPSRGAGSQCAGFVAKRPSGPLRRWCSRCGSHVEKHQGA